MSKHVFSVSSNEQGNRGTQKRRISAAGRKAMLDRCVLEGLETRQLLSVTIPLLNGDFQSPTWVSNGGVWDYQPVQPGTQALNSNNLDPRFGPPGFGKTAQSGNGPGPNGEGLYNEHNDLGYNQYFSYTNGSLPAPASGTNFFSIESGPSGGTYNVWVDQQPNTTVDAGNHYDLHYPPLIPATFAIAAHTYQVTVALGNPLINASSQGSNPELAANVALDITIGAATYNEPSNTNSLTTPPQPGDTTLFYDGSGTTVQSAYAEGSSDPNWHLTPGTFQNLTATWTCPSADAGLPLDLNLVFNCYGEESVCMSNIQFVDLTGSPTAPAAPSGVTATAASPSQTYLSWTNNANNQTGFTIERATNSSFTQNVATFAAAASATSCWDSGLAASSTYYYEVAATNSVGPSTYSAAASTTTGALGMPVAVPVPDGNFADPPAYYINLNYAGSFTFTSPMTATLSGWAVSATPSTAHSGTYSGWEPVGAVDSVSSSGTSPLTENTASIGNQPGSSYRAFTYSPGELYNSGGVVGGAQPGASLTMTTTGMGLVAATGSTYTATIEYANVSQSNCNANASANVALNILANGTVVGTGSLSGLAQGAPWTTVTATWVCPTADAGDAIQLQAVATRFLEGPGSSQQWEVPTFAFTNTTLTSEAPASTVPSGLTATPASQTQINLSWGTVSGATSYDVYRSASSGSEGTTPYATGITSTAYSDTGCTTSTTYYYTVSEVTSSGPGPQSTEVHATTYALPTTTGVVAAAVSSTQINLSWNAVSGATSYDVYRSTSSGGEGTTPYASGISGTTYSDTGCAASTTYYYTVSAVSGTGSGAPSTEVNAATPAALGATVVSFTQINLSWGAISGATSYNVYRSTSSGSEGTTPYASGIAGTTYSDMGCVASTTYYYTLSEVTSSGPGPQSAQINVTTPTPLVAPTGVTAATASSTQINLSWNAVTGAASYDVYRSTSSGSEGTMPYASGISGTTYSDMGCVASTTYYYTVSAVNVGGVGPQSTEVHATTSATTFSDADFGSPGMAGSESFDGTTYTVKGGGATWGTSDQGNFYNTSTSGNATLIAAITGADSTEKDGIMFRNSLTANDLFADTSWCAASGVNFQYRASVSANLTSTFVTGVTAPSTSNPLWVKLVDAGNVFSGYYSTNGGTTWTQVGSSATVSLGSTYLAGLFVNARNNSNLSTGTFTNLSLATGIPAAPTGVTAAAASSTQINLSWNTVSGAASYDVYRSTSSGSEGTTPYASGIATTTYSDTSCSASTTYYYTVSAVNSSGTGAQSTEVYATTPAAGVPGQPTGVAATAASAAQINLSWNTVSGATSYDVYRSTSSGSEGTTPYASGITSPAYSDTACAASTTYYYTVSAVNSYGTGTQSAEVHATTLAWSDGDIGSPGRAGSESYSAGTWTVNGGGGVWGTSDQLNFYSSSQSGDATLVAAITGADSTEKDGIMFRNSSAANDMFVDVSWCAATGVNFQYRSAAGGAITSTVVTGVTAPSTSNPLWVKTVRSGNVFSGYYSTNGGSTWIQIGSSVTISMNSTYLAGLFVNARNNSNLSTGTFTNLDLT